MRIAKRVHSLAQEQNDPTLMIGGCAFWQSRSTILGDFETARKYSILGVQLWRSSGVQSQVEEVRRGYARRRLSVLSGPMQWHFGEIASCQPTMAEAISAAKELNNMHALAHALWHAGWLAHFERNPAEVERFRSELIELSNHQNFANFAAQGSRSSRLGAQRFR